MRNEDKIMEVYAKEFLKTKEIMLKENFIGAVPDVVGSLYDAFYANTDNDGAQKEPIPDPRYIPVYTKEDIDKIVMMLTLWIPDLDIRNKLEEIYQCWKDTQKL